MYDTFTVLKDGFVSVRINLKEKRLHIMLIPLVDFTVKIRHTIGHMKRL